MDRNTNEVLAMYSVLLVDDEENILELLKTIIQWKDLGTGCLLTAQSAQHALSILGEQKIDLMITDIKMPDMDGITLVKQVRQLYPNIHCVLLTAYGEFEYARQAIELGVENYLLKPVSQEELVSTVRKAFGNIYAKKEIGRDLLRENILQRWTHGSISEEELCDRAILLNINVYLPQYCVICIRKIKDESIQKFISMCEDLLRQKNEVYHFWDEKSRYVLIVGGKQIGADGFNTQFSEFAEKCHVQNAVRIAIGSTVSNISSLHLSYRFACECIDLIELNSEKIVLRHEDVSPDFLMDCFAEEIRFSFFEKDEKTQESCYNRLILKLYQSIQHGETDQRLGLILKSCIYVLLSEFPLQEGIQEELYDGDWKIEKDQSLECFCAEAKAILNSAQNLFQRYFGQYSPIVQLAVCYARRNALEGISGSVKEFCTKNNINSAYLGHLYKKETGLFFSDYMIQCAINRSVVLLGNPNFKIKTVAEKVGFTSASYYVKCFRENKGMSPSKFRTRLGEQ